MQVIQSLAWYFPESSGGTEVYVDALVRELWDLGVSSQIVAADDKGTSRSYDYTGTQVFRYPVASVVAPEVLRGEAPPAGFDHFYDWLKAQQADIYHQHSWTLGCGLHHLRAAKVLGFKTVLTIHVPSSLCLRGTMLRFGDIPCDGRIEETRCAACWAQGRGLPASLAHLLGNLPRVISAAAERYRHPSRLTTALAARALAHAKRQQFEQMVSSADRIVAVCDWLLTALRANGVPEDKLVLSRQGVSANLTDARRDRPPRSDPVRIGFLGRWHPTKGVHILLEALRRLPDSQPLEVVIHGMVGGDEDRHYRDQVMACHGLDPRLRIEPPVPRDQVAEILAGFDWLAVPSQLLETGPLVVLEAQVMGTPVLGSNLGGIQELVTHGVDGWLVDPANTTAWADALLKAVRGTLLPAQSRPPRQVRRMADAAREMAGLYESLLT